jgi:hypothetical protein
LLYFTREREVVNVIREIVCSNSLIHPQILEISLSGGLSKDLTTERTKTTEKNLFATPFLRGMDYDTANGVDLFHTRRNLMLSVEIKENDKTVGLLTATEKAFKTGSKGYFGMGKIQIGEKRYQVQVQLVEIGSKPKPEELALKSE